MAEPKPTLIGPPWKGLCLVDSLETPQHDVCAINIDYAYGAKRARRGYRWVTNGYRALPTYPALFQHVFGDTGKYIIAIGGSALAGYSDVTVVVMDEYGQPAFGTFVNSTYNLTTLYGEPQVENFILVDAATALISTAGGQTRQVTVLSTQYQSYIFDPLEVPAYRVRPMSAAQVSVGGDAQQLAGGSFPYFATAPHGYIIERHQEAYWYAGWRAGDTVVLESVNPVTGTPSPLTNITQDVTRQTQSMGPWIVAYSDPSDPAGVLGWHIFGVDGMEQVTGLQSQNQSLLIFTPTSTYVLQGNDDSSFTKQTVSRGIGCGGHATIVDVDGLTYWLDYNGAYSLSPGDGIKCLSNRIKPLWTGQHQTTVQSSNFPAEEWGWPYAIERGLLKYARGTYHRPSRSIWWFVPVRAYFPKAVFGDVQTIQLVYNIDFEAWSIWIMPEIEQEMLWSATVIETASGTKAFMSDRAGTLYEYGFDVADGDGTLYPQSLWMSGRIMSGSNVQQVMRKITLKVLERGLADNDPPKLILRGERYVVDPDNTDTAKGESAVTCQPHYGDDDTNLWSSGGGTQVWGTTQWAAVDWVTLQCDTGLQYSSPTVRIGAVDLEARLVCQSFTIEDIAPLGTTTRNFQGRTG